jgi:hypothetical protein
MKPFYKYRVIYIFFIFFIISCNNQKREEILENFKNNIKNKKSNSPNKQNKTMKKLNKAILEKYKKNNKYIENDSLFEMRDQGDRYQEIKSKIGGKLKSVSTYDKEKLVLIDKGDFMFDFPLGIHIKYDLEGNTIQERNYDEDFPLTFENLKEKLLNEFNINIENNNLDLHINRSSTPPNYTVILYNEDRSKYRIIDIDGITGEIIDDKIFRSMD